MTDRRVQADGSGGFIPQHTELDMDAYNRARESLQSLGLDFSVQVVANYKSNTKETAPGFNRDGIRKLYEIDTTPEAGGENLQRQVRDAEDKVMDSARQYRAQLESPEEKRAFADLVADGGIKTDVKLRLQFDDAAQGANVVVGQNDMQVNVKGNKIDVTTDELADEQALEAPNINSITFTSSPFAPK